LVGTELLTGSVQDRNLVELARALRALGIALVRAVVVGDDIDAIATEVKDLSDRVDVVFTSGGVGPTHDDVTIEAVAKAFGVGTVVDERMRRALEGHYGAPLSPDYLRMAKVPRGACLQMGPDQSWPTIVKENVWILPGVPNIFRHKLDVIRAHLRGPVAFRRAVVSCSLDELSLLAQLDGTVAKFPNVLVGSYPKANPSDPPTKVTFDGTDATEVENATQHFLGLLPDGCLLAVERN
jgi:molybdenum cofactor synthesis domain-containing protein